jgi:large subunit ribosomal protein L4
MKLDIFDVKKNKVGDIDVDDSVFAGPVKKHLFWEVVRMQLTNKRRGTQSTKTVTFVSGTGKKPFRQKGTGRARAGSLRSGHMVGGAVILGPLPRDYSYEMPKKMVKGALRSALSLRNSESKLFVVKDWKPNGPKTKAAKAVLEVFGDPKANDGRGTSTLVIDSRDNESLSRSIRNLPNAKFLPVEGINVRDILAYDNLIIGEGVVGALVDRLKATKLSRKDKEAAGA